MLKYSTLGNVIGHSPKLRPAESASGCNGHERAQLSSATSIAIFIRASAPRSLTTIISSPPDKADSEHPLDCRTNSQHEARQVSSIPPACPPRLHCLC